MLLNVRLDQPQSLGTLAIASFASALLPFGERPLSLLRRFVELAPPRLLRHSPQRLVLDRDVDLRASSTKARASTPAARACWALASPEIGARRRASVPDSSEAIASSSSPRLIRLSRMSPPAATAPRSAMTSVLDGSDRPNSRAIRRLDRPAADWWGGCCP